MITPAASIKFPFGRGIEYPLAALKSFEAELSETRRVDCALDNELRAPETGSPRWIKLRNEELVPLEYYVGHKGVSDAANFMIMPEGSKIDIRLSNSGITENLQITIADPKWDFPEPESIKQAGHHHRLSMEILNRDGYGGWGPITKNGDKITQDRRMVSTLELDAHHAGLVEAIGKKFQKKYKDGEYVLLVYARKYCQGLSLDRFLDTARSALDEAKSKVNNIWTFKTICILDYNKGYFIESPN